jgi:hypothetical protein
MKTGFLYLRFTIHDLRLLPPPAAAAGRLLHLTDVWWLAYDAGV